MNPNQPPELPARIVRYVPYAYAAVPPAAPRAAPLDDAAVTAEGEMRRPRPYTFSDRQTVEDLIARGYLALPTGDPVTATLTDRLHTAWLGLDDALTQIRARLELYHHNLNAILYATAAATNAAHTWYAQRGPLNAKQLDNLYRTLQGLYAEERQERVRLWQDLSRVRQLVPELARQYLSSNRKVTLLDLGGELE